MQNPRLIHVGAHTGFFTFNLFDAQAWLCRDFILGKFELPSKQAMAAHDSMMTQRCHDLIDDDGGHGNYDHRCINFQGDYLADLVSLTDYPSFNVEDVKALFFEWEEHKAQGIITFRNHGYKSVMTGNVAPLLLDRDGKTVIHWKDAMAETCESFGMHDLFDGNVRKMATGDN
jgi:trimethylamine monooxygenase